jgi:hypothetical protein
MDTKEDFIEFYDKHIGSSPEEWVYAIFDKIGTSEKGNSDRNYAGTAALSAPNPVNAATELGVLIFPAFQRTHVATNAIGLLVINILTSGSVRRRAKPRWEYPFQDSPFILRVMVSFSLSFEMSHISAGQVLAERVQLSRTSWTKTWCGGGDHISSVYIATAFPQVEREQAIQRDFLQQDLILDGTKGRLRI